MSLLFTENADRRRGRRELSLVSAIIALVQKDHPLLAALSPQTKLNPEVTLSNVCPDLSHSTRHESFCRDSS
jgi:hypothetical protein